MKIEWANPHARIYIDVKDDKGMIANWDFEMGSPNGLMRLGWRRRLTENGRRDHRERDSREERTARWKRPERDDGQDREATICGIFRRGTG